MTAETYSNKELKVLLQETASALIQLLEKFDDRTINIVPFAGSWTGAQVIDHLTKSNRSISKALLLKGTASNREADERVAELKSVFLNFDTKFKSPDFILPDNGIFRKEILNANLAHSFSKLREHADTIDLSDMINHPVFGDITKFEILYFVVFHTQRHIRQLENIYKITMKK